MVPNGDKMHPYGTNPKGVAMFDADGRVFVIFAHPDLPRIVSNNVGLKRAAASTVGRSPSTDDADNVISLRLEASTFIVQVGGGDPAAEAQGRRPKLEAELSPSADELEVQINSHKTRNEPSPGSRRTN